VEVSDEELRKVSFLQHPQQVIGVFPIPSSLKAETMDFSSLTLALDGVQDPGNVGTIIRIADWFGIETIICSPDTADCFNPKVVQATMGAIARIKVHYGDLEELFETYPDLPVYGTFLDGKDIYKSELGKKGFVLFGNEGQGISAKVAKHVDQRLLIPKAKTAGSESLNVGVAAAITISEFFRR
jgi:TrmH family RNA methyltransferase